MAHHKREKRKSSRAGCSMCKPWKDNEFKNTHEAQSIQEKRARITDEDEIEYAEMLYTTAVLRCDKCSSLGEYCETHDAYFCSECNTWLEPKCSDPGCEFCKDRRDNE